MSMKSGGSAMSTRSSTRNTTATVRTEASDSVKNVMPEQIAKRFSPEHKKEKTLECSVCQKTFSSKAVLLRHSRVHSEEKPFACMNCGCQFHGMDELKHHEASHEDKSQICCNICSCDLQTTDELMNHIKLAHNIIIKPSISSAGYTFRSSAVVKSYLDTYRSDNPQPCYICFEEFPNSGELLKHFATHDVFELIKGSTDKGLWGDSLSYAEAEYLRWRKKRDTVKTKSSSLTEKGNKQLDDSAEFTHVCRICHQMFKGLEMLLDHWLQKKGKRSHDGLVGKEGQDSYVLKLVLEKGKPKLLCTKCEELLTSAAEAAKHISTHNNTLGSPDKDETKTSDAGQEKSNSVDVNDEDTEHLCLTCGEVVKDVGEFVLHQSLHESDTKVLCSICSAYISDVSELKEHIQMHKNEDLNIQMPKVKNFLCPVCGKLYSRPEDMKKHLIQHVALLFEKGNTSVESNYKCESCTQMFLSQKDLQYHSIYHGAYVSGRSLSEKESNVCPICGKTLARSSSLVGHIKLHAQEKEFACKICGRSFRCSRNRDRHVKTHTGIKEFVCEICGKGLARKAEYETHMKRHELNPSFNGKAGRKKGTKVINNKVVYASNISLSQDGKQTERDGEIADKESCAQIFQIGENHVILNLQDDQAASETTYMEKEKSIIPKKKKKKMEYVMVDGTGAILEGQHNLTFLAQNVETQTDILASEESLARNIDIITAEMQQEESHAEAPALGPLVGNIDAADIKLEPSAGNEDDDVMIIVQDPATGENEVLSIKSFQEGGSKLIAPNEELLKALQCFQNSRDIEGLMNVTDCEIPDSNVVTEMVASSSDYKEDGETLVVASAGKCEVNASASSEGMDDLIAKILPNLQEDKESAVCITECLPNETMTIAKIQVQDEDIVYTVTPSDFTHASPSKTSAADDEGVEDKQASDDQERSERVETEDQKTEAVPPSQHVKVISFTMDAKTGELIPLCPQEESSICNKQQRARGRKSKVGKPERQSLTVKESDSTRECQKVGDAVDLLKDTKTVEIPENDVDLTVVQALMQMKLPDNGVKVSDIRDNSESDAPSTSEATSSGQRNWANTAETKSIDSHSTVTLKSSSDRHVKTATADSAGVQGSPLKSSCEKIVTESSGKIIKLKSTSSERDECALTQIMDTSESLMTEDNDSNYEDDGSSVCDSDDNFVPPSSKKKILKIKQESNSLEEQPVRRSARNSYKGVSEIIAKLKGRRRSTHALSSRHVSTRVHDNEEVSVQMPNRKSQESFSKPDMVSCNICKKHLLRINMKQHIDKEHGSYPYKCGICGDAYDNNVDFLVHILSHEKSKRIKQSLSVLTETIQTTTQAGSEGECQELSGEATAAILALEREGDLQEVLSSVDVNVNELIIHTEKNQNDGTTTFTLTSSRSDSSVTSAPKTNVTATTNSESLERVVSTENSLDKDNNDQDSLKCICGLCGYRFSTVHLLTRHVTSHYREKPFSCDLCLRKYGRKDELEKHRMSHRSIPSKGKKERRKLPPKLKNGKYPCPECTEQFVSYQVRYQHILTHEKPAQDMPATVSVKTETKVTEDNSSLNAKCKCDVCGLEVSTPRHLRRHKLVHTNERTWLCQECGKSFLRKDDLRIHQKRHERKVKTDASADTSENTDFFRKCPFCERTFTSFHEFRSHTKTHKSEKFDGSLKCKICEKVFIKHISLRNHMQKHQDTYKRGMKKLAVGSRNSDSRYDCEHCGKKIKSKSNFVRHMKLHNQGKPFECPTCKRNFARESDLRVHERRHIGERPFLCNLCGKSFLSSSSLSTHVKKHDQAVVYKFSCAQCENLFASRKEFKEHIETCTPKTVQIVLEVENIDEAVETIQFLQT